jgi:hypothetical protein
MIFGVSKPKSTPRRVRWQPLTGQPTCLLCLLRTVPPRQLELRRQLDVDGWTADVTTLRKTLAAVDRKLLQMRLIDRCAQ